MEWFTSTIERDPAARAAILETARHQALLWMICDVRAKDREYHAALSIGTGHLPSVSAGSDEGVEKSPHAVVKHLIGFHRPSFIGAACKTGNGKVAEENCASLRGLTADVLREVAEGDVNGICGFVAAEV